MKNQKAKETQLDFKEAYDVINAHNNSDDKLTWAKQFSIEELSYMLDLFDAGYDIINTYKAVRDAYDWSIEADAFRAAFE